MRSYKLHFIRHGLTSANMEGRFIGTTDLPLCNEGIQSLFNQRRDMIYPDVQKVYTSPAERCRQTADILYPNTFTVIHNGLAEMDLGKLEGKTLDEIKDDSEFVLWLQDSVNNSVPGGENPIELTKRIIGTIQGIFTEMMEQKIYEAVIITHGGIIMTALAGLGLPKQPASSWIVDSGEGYSVLMTPEMWLRDGGFEVFAKIPQSHSQLDEQWLLERYGTTNIEGLE